MAGKTGEIVYPTGCQEVQENMQLDELIRRLKALASHFQAVDQEGYDTERYIPLAFHLVEVGFLNHISKDVRLLIACCTADILRIYAPEAPYKDSELVKTIFYFLIQQLDGLKNPKDHAFKRYFYLLENLAYVKSFNMCIELEDSQIICTLFETFFNVINDDHSAKVKSFMLDTMCPLIMDSESVPDELLTVILKNIIEPVKSKRKWAYNLARDVVIRCSEILEPYIQNLFNQLLICGIKEDSPLFTIQKRVYELIYELNQICSSILLSVLPQLEYKLKSSNVEDRMGSVSLLARMFSEKESFLAVHHSQLWQAFLGRFNDIVPAIRIKCVQHSMHFWINHPELRADIVAILKTRQHDADENVRLEVVKSIAATAKCNFEIVGQSEDLLNYVKERTLDKKFKIRKEALQGLALIYKTHLTIDYVPKATLEAVSWMKDRILHSYYLTSLEDRILVERLLNSCLVPYQLKPKDRMLKVLYLYATLDPSASKAFVEIQKTHLSVRKNLNEFLVCIRNRDDDPDFEQHINLRISQLSKFLPDMVKASEFLCTFFADLQRDAEMMKAVEQLLGNAADCKTSVEKTNFVLKKLGSPVMTNLYYKTVKCLLERASSVLFDKMAISKLLGILQDIIHGNEETLKAIGCDKKTGISKGFYLLGVLAYVFPAHFDEPSSVEILIQMLADVSEDIQPLILKALTYVGKYVSIGSSYESLGGPLVSTCQEILSRGTPKQGKEAIRCLHVHTKAEDRLETFSIIIEDLKQDLFPKNSNYRTAIVALGHIAFLMPEAFQEVMKNIVAQKIVKELLVNPQRSVGDGRKTGNWCEEEDLPKLTRSMMAGMKTVVRWLLGLQVDLKCAAKTFKMLTAFVETGGEFINSKVAFSDAEKSWLRLTAGCCMLKICEQKGVGDQFSAIQFFTLSKLMNNEVPEIRSRFAFKLHCGLSRGIPNRCLPLDFMGFYSLAGYDSDKSHKNTVKTYVASDISKRREYIKALKIAAAERAVEQLPRIMPDYMLVFSIAVLSHNPRFTSYDDVDQLEQIKNCLWFILEPLIIKSESYSFGFYKNMLERVKNHKDALDPENDDANFKIYAVCDLALGLIMQKGTIFEIKIDDTEPRIPQMYFKHHQDPFHSNRRSYVPDKMLLKRRSGSGIVQPWAGGKRKKTQKVDAFGNVCIDAEPTDARETIQDQNDTPIPSSSSSTGTSTASSSKSNF